MPERAEISTAVFAEGVAEGAAEGVAEDWRAGPERPGPVSWPARPVGMGHLPAALLLALAALMAGPDPAGAEPPPPVGLEDALNGTSDPGPGLGNAADNTPRLYIVQLEAPAAVPPRRRPPAAGSSGRIRREADSQKPGPTSERPTADEVVASHDELLAAIGAADAKVYSYRYTLNGFAARLTPAQARKLAGMPGVRRVSEDRRKYTETNTVNSFLGLNDRAQGLAAARGLRGDGVIIGVIDSGITPGHPSFSDVREARRPRVCRTDWAETTLLGLWLCQRFKNREDQVVYQRPDHWQGACETGEGWTAANCNQKLIGARFYLEGFLQDYEMDADEFLSPRDADGHGTHIAATAAGNPVNAVIAGQEVAGIRGVAPRAHVAVYKACWLEPLQLRGTCSTADLAKAIEDAVADGVDIINYSVGSSDGIRDADDDALLAATEAGVLAVVAAGNDGPEPLTVLSPGAAPWTLAVGASSRRGDRYQPVIRVDAPAAIDGNYPAIEAGFTPGLRTAGPVSGEVVLVDDGDTVLADGTAGSTSDACEALVNDTEIAGRIAFVTRGGCNFDVKVANAEDAGADAVIVANDDGAPVTMVGTRNVLDIPAVMISEAAGNLIREQLEDGTAVEVTLDHTFLRTVRDNGNVMADFSARGPNFWAPDVLKPDVTAPGVNILAAQTPDVANNQRGERYQYLSGTSMSVPVVAGAAALLREAHPDWSPAAIKSALMTTARQNVVKEDGSTPADPFDFGAGHIAPNPAVAPGLVFEAAGEDYDAFLCGTGEPRLDDAGCEALATGGLSLAPADLNLPSVALSELPATQVVRRRVTGVDGGGTWTATVEAPDGIQVEVVPGVISVADGESADYEIRFATDGSLASADEAWRFGAVIWSNGSTTVRTPFAVRPVGITAPGVLVGEGPDGNLPFTVTTGYTGGYGVALSGLELPGESQPDSIRPQLTGATVRDDGRRQTGYDAAGADEDVPDDVRRLPIVVPDNTRLLRVSLYNEDTGGNDLVDLDLYLYYCPAFIQCYDLGAASGNSDSNEVITILDPSPGEYYVDVHGFDTGSATVSFDLSVWTLGPDRGNLAVTAPGSVTAGDPATVELGWQGLAPGRHLGLLRHRDDGADERALTLVEIRVPAVEALDVEAVEAP